MGDRRVIISFAVTMMVIVGVLYWADQHLKMHAPQEATPQVVRDEGLVRVPHATRVLRDSTTGCHYLIFSHHIIPRLDGAGSHYGCNEVNR